MFDAIQDALVGVLNTVIAAFGAAMNGIISAWPIEMPELPETPAGLVEALGWIRWTPLPVAGILALILFLVACELVWMAAAVILRWAKAVDV